MKSNPGSNQIYMPGHTFQTGDLVTYKVNSGSGVSGLVNGAVYQVVSLDSNFIQLKPKAGGSVIAISTTQSQNDAGETYTLTAVGAGPVGGLVNGTIYVVKLVNANTIQLTDLSGHLISLGAAGVGTHHLVTDDDVQLTTVTGPQEVYLDLQASGTGTALLGVGGVDLGTVLVPSGGDGISHVSVYGMTGGVVSGSSSTATLTITSVVETIVAGGTPSTPTILDGNTVTVTANGQVYGSAAANGDAGGLFAFPGSDAQVFINGTAEAVVGDLEVANGSGSTVVNTGSLTVTATALYEGTSDSGGIGGGAFAISGSDAMANTTYLTEAGLGQDVSVSASVTLIEAHTSHDETINIRNSADGLGAGSEAGRKNNDAGSGAIVQGQNIATLGAGTVLQNVIQAQIISLVDNSNVSASSSSHTDAGAGGSNATAAASASDKVGIEMGGSEIIGVMNPYIYPLISIQTAVDNYNMSTHVHAVLDAFAGDTHATSDDDAAVVGYIHAGGATLVYNLQAPPSIGNSVSVQQSDSDVDADGATVGPSDETHNDKNETSDSDNVMPTFDPVYEPQPQAVRANMVRSSASPVVRPATAVRTAASKTDMASSLATNSVASKALPITSKAAAGEDTASITPATGAGVAAPPAVSLAHQATVAAFVPTSMSAADAIENRVSHTVVIPAAPVGVTASLGPKVLLRIGRVDIATEVVLPSEPDAAMWNFGFGDHDGPAAAVPDAANQPAASDAGSDWSLVPLTGTESRRGKGGIKW